MVDLIEYSYNNIHSISIYKVCQSNFQFFVQVLDLKLSLVWSFKSEFK